MTSQLQNSKRCHFEFTMKLSNNNVLVSGLVPQFTVIKCWTNWYVGFELTTGEQNYQANILLISIKLNSDAIQKTLTEVTAKKVVENRQVNYKQNPSCNSEENAREYYAASQQ